MNVEKICRCCLANEESLASIYDANLNNTNYTLAHMIKEITLVKPELGDKLPDKVCSSCISDIRCYYNFKIKCERSNRTLQQLFRCEVRVHLDSNLNSSKTIQSTQLAKEIIHVPKVCLEKTLNISQTTARRCLEEKILLIPKEENIAVGKNETNLLSPEQNTLLPQSFSTPTSNVPSSYSCSTGTSMQLIPLEINVKQELNDSDTIFICSSVPEDVTATEIKLKQEYDSDNFPGCSKDQDNIETIYTNLKSIKKMQHINNTADSNSNQNLNNVNSGDNSVNLSYHCVICKKSLLNNYELADHLESHEKPYTCTCCNIVFNNYTTLSKHIFENTGKHFECHLCHKNYNSLSELNNHFCTAAITQKYSQISQKQENEKRYACKLCPKRFRTSCQLKCHLRSHTGEKPYKCRFCDKTFRYISSRTTHERGHTGEEPFKCNYCDKTFKQQSTWKVHERTHTGETPYKCKYCKKGFKQLTNRKQHEMVCHSASIKSEPGSELQHDLSSDVRQKRFECSYCDKRFFSAGYRKIHERIHTGEAPYKCKYCEKSFKQGSSCVSHERVHTGEAPYKCSYCEISFKTRTSCDRHEERYHSASIPKPFKCNYCDKRFNKQSACKTHEKTHTAINSGEGLYKCSYCDKMFRQTCLKIIHERSHTGEKPFKCNYCDKRFTQVYARSTHERRHTGKRPFKCNYCAKGFTTTRMCRAHERIHTRET